MVKARIRTWGRSALRVGIVASWLAALPSMAQEVLPTARFFEPPAMSDGTMSPEGTHLALIVGQPGQRRRLVVMDVQSMAAKVVAGFQDGDVTWATWLNDSRLLLRVRTQGDVWRETLHAVDRDGANLSIPLEGRSNYEQPLQAAGRYQFANRSRTNDLIFLTFAKWDLRGNYQRSDLLRVDTRTLKRSLVEVPGETTAFLLDDADEPLAVVTREPPGRAVWYRDASTQAWRRLAAFEQYGANVITPLAPGPAGSATLFVRANNGRDTSALHLYDLKSNQLDPQPVLSVQGHDFNGDLVRRNGAVVGVRYEGDTTATVWLDAEHRALQEKVDALLPGTQNHLSGGVRHKSSKWLVFARSDTDPGRFYLFDSASGGLTALGAFRQGIDPRRMARVDVVRYPARDGLAIPALVTLPTGRPKPWPLVVLVDASPWSRTSRWGWEGQAQFLASRGYAVLQPDHRGTQGYGRKHFEAGWKQMGLAMQDDLADGVKWAVAQGIADPEKVCIAGFEYGGYAALMALARDGALFRCGVALHPVTDLEAHASNFLAFNEEFRSHGIGRLIGDPERDAAQLRSTSPVHRAAEIRKPLLLGAWDGHRAIPFQHASRMRDALAAHPALDWLSLPAPKSWSQQQEQWVTAWERIERFLAKHNPAGQDTAPAPAAPQSPR